MEIQLEILKYFLDKFMYFIIYILISNTYDQTKTLFSQITQAGTAEAD